MARRAMRIKAARKPKFMTRNGPALPDLRPRRGACYRKFGLCRICFRQNASAGYIPGILKASW